MNELHPSECLIRLCRFCKHHMRQQNYESDTEYRWYTFSCESCGYYTTIGEPISDVFMDNWATLEHEPLHHTEEYQQNNHKYR